ncbi:hypothetical protein NW762_007859 [Fusarium torreyae]|uniref:NACHT-NTPase and P-loop NTPases N-terminal domain-containing protein n=1 Tax=Fusarium torreyae TaxID=1237075 RepID=A0A9W8RZP2_9HYPO|nr:hypothetical protein NW762_007859 [Fusarium torreyae]
MAEILGLASSIITVVGVAGKLGTSTVRLKRLWDEVQEVPTSIRRCIEQLDLLAPAIEEMDIEFQKTSAMVQHDSAAKRSLEYSQKAVETLETLVRDMEKHINSERKSKRLLAQLKVRIKKEVIEEHQQQLNFALQLVSLSQQTYLMYAELYLALSTRHYRALNHWSSYPRSKAGRSQNASDRCPAIPGMRPKNWNGQELMIDET